MFLQICPSSILVISFGCMLLFGFGKFVRSNLIVGVNNHGGVDGLTERRGE